MRIARLPLAVVILPTLLPPTGCHARQPSPAATEATPGPTTPSRPAIARQTVPTPFAPSPLAVTLNPSPTTQPAPHDPAAPWDPRLFDLTLIDPHPAATITTPPTPLHVSAGAGSLQEDLSQFNRPADDVVYRWIQQRRGGVPDLIDDWSQRLDLIDDRR